MKLIFSLLLIVIVIFTAGGQPKKKGKVKRKYRDVEQIAQTQIPVFLRGSVYDQDEIPLAGATVTIDGTVKGVNTNEFGEFVIDNLITGKARIRVSFVGFETKTTDLELRNGENYKDIMLTRQNIHLEPITVNAQKRDQQIMDVPAAISAVSAKTIENANITELGHLSDFVPGLYIREQGADRPSFVIRGLSSEEVSASAQPRVSVYYNNVPVNRASLASVELFDMDRVETLKGPQNTLFGRGAQTGAIHFVSKMPDNQLGGYITAGGGNYSQKEFRTAINVPAIENKLFFRIAGIYSALDGYVENTFGGTLNGKNTLAGRFSGRFLPQWNHKIDLVLNYQKDETPGIAFMTKTFPNTNGVTGVFSDTASLEQGENLKTGKDFFDATLSYKYYIDENTSWTSITSYRNGNSSSRWDGDGTASAAIDMAETAGARQFYQEIRGNFSQNSRLIGSLGASYWWEKANQNYWFSPNEQQFASLMFFQPPMPVYPDGQPVIIQALPPMPEFGFNDSIPLPANHQEENLSFATNQSIEAFIDVTYQIVRKIFLIGGIRGTFDMYKLSNEAQFAGGDPSALGMFTGNTPNLFFRESPLQNISKNTLAVTGKAGIQYKFNEYGNVFANYARGRRPNVLQFTSTGEEEILDAEILDNYDAGFKASFFERVYIDAVGFYQKYKNFKSSAWISNPETGEFNYKIIDGGKATSYGAEATINVALIKQLSLFGNYAWLHSAFDSTNVDGLQQEYAGNSFSLAPDHTFTAGFNAQLKITPNILFFITPSYSYKSHLFFSDANTPGLEQDAYGLLNVNGGLKLEEPMLTLSVYCTNMLNTEYVTSGGNTGSMFGVPTFVPGVPAIYGAKLTWQF